MASSKQKSGVRERLGRVLTVCLRTEAQHSRSSLPAQETTEINRIRKVAKFEDLYTIGEEVMPCGHRHMSVHYATRRSDGLKCVVKRRYKPHCFKVKEDEMAWRRCTEYMLNLPESSNIAKLHEVLEDQYAFNIVMEKVSGMDLFEALNQEGLSLEHARDIIQQLLRAMVHLHSNGAVHKDLKLENVMVDNSELSPNYQSTKSDFSDASVKSGNSNLSPACVKVIDFDTVAEFDTVAKDVVGTDQYIATEAYHGEFSPMSDIFAVGVIAYKLLSRKFPFNHQMFDDKPGQNWVGSPKMKEISAKLKTSAINFSHSVFQEDPLAADLVKRMLSHSASERPSAEEALDHPWFQDSISPSTTKDTVSTCVPESPNPAAEPKELHDLVHDFLPRLLGGSADSKNQKHKESEEGEISSAGSGDSWDITSCCADEGIIHTPCKKQICRPSAARLLMSPLRMVLPSSMKHLNHF